MGAVSCKATSGALYLDKSATSQSGLIGTLDLTYKLVPKYLSCLSLSESNKSEWPKSQILAMHPDGRSRDGNTITLSSFTSPWTIPHWCRAINPQATSPAKMSFALRPKDLESRRYFLNEPSSPYSKTIYGAGRRSLRRQP